MSSGVSLDDPLVPGNPGQDKPVSNNGEDLSKERPAICELLRKHKGPRQHTSRENRRKGSRPQKLKIIEPSLEGDSMGNRSDNTVVQIRGLPTNKCSASTFSDNGFEAQEPFNEMEGSSDPSLVGTSASGVQLSEAGHEGKIVSEPQIGGLPINKCGASTFSDNGLEARGPFNVTEGPSDPCFVETSASGVQISEAGNEGKIVGEPQIGGLPINKCDASTFSDNGLEAQGPFNVIEGFSDPSLVETSASGVQLREAENEGKFVAEPQIGGLPPINKFSDNGLEAQETFNVIEGSSEPSMVESSTSGVQLSEGGNEEQIDVLPSTVGEQLEKRAIIEKARAEFKTRPVKPPEERPSLPFEKCSFMWDSIESMEVFSLMPQHPHFRPLEEYQKDFREGMAIGLMVTFSNLVNSIRKLAITDHRDKFNDMLKILENLEAHGFDVRHLQDRLVELLRMKENQERAMNERSNLEVMLVKRKGEKNQFDSELAFIEKAIKELDQSLSCLQEEKVHISEEKRGNDSTLDELEEDLRRVESALRSATHDFEAVLSAKW
ncbi:DUF724 domain-containing protein 1-like [Asparagus officinalis]|nr:DUF724 domain-containing protein 1-like [Asparagus officinalis]